MSRTTSRAVPVGPKVATFREIIRRLDAIERRLNHGIGSVPESDFARKFEIIEAEHLRRQVARHSSLQQENPVLWRQLETDRRAQDRETAALDRRLRAGRASPSRTRAVAGAAYEETATDRRSRIDKNCHADHTQMTFDSKRLTASLWHRAIPGGSRWQI